MGLKLRFGFELRICEENDREKTSEAAIAKAFIQRLGLKVEYL
jgi:hypothetical protein